MFPASLFNILLIVFLVLFGSLASSNTSNSSLPSINDFASHDAVSWRRLIHLAPSSSSLPTPTVLSEGFYLSAGNLHHELAEQELQATISLFRDADNGAQAICRFPARFLWLRQHYQFDPKLTLKHCARFIEWSGFNSLDTISLIFVSGYMGNPASTFGHVLLKLNSNDGQYSNGFFDLAINFGARVPPGEAGHIYITKGLFGGYTASFTNEDYYRRDLVYTNSEQRDAVEYKLKLNEFQKQLLIAHLWELNNHVFQYYFLRQNCAYRIAELLELVLENDNIIRRELSYAPATLFHNMEQYAPAAIADVTLIPSPKRSIFARFQDLPKDHQQIFNQLVSADGDVKTSYQTLDMNEEQRSRFLDLLLDYNTYRLASVADEDKPTLLARRKVIVSERLRLPPSDSLSARVRGQFQSPIGGSRPSRINLSHTSNYGIEDRTSIAFSPFYYDALGQHGESGSEIIMMNTELSYADKGGTIRLDHIDFLKIQRVNTTTPAIEREKRFSWRLGLQGSNNKGCRACLDLDFSMGLGRAFELNKRMLVYGFVDALYDGQYKEFAVSPTVAAVYSYRQFGVKVDLRSRYLVTSGRTENQLDIELRYRIEQNLEAGVVFGHGENDRATIKLAYYF